MISGVLLGAGESRRMGRNKLFLPYEKTTVFERCLGVLLRSEVQELIVVLGNRSKALQPVTERCAHLFRKRIKIVLNLHSREGMSTSIRKGLEALDSRSEGVLIALGDQPFLKTRTVNALVHAFVHGEEKIVLPFYRGRRGNPVLFDRFYVEELLKLQGDVGGRSIVDSHLDKVMRVRTRCGGVIKDIDTWEEYKKLKAQSLKAPASRPQGRKSGRW